MGVSDSPIIYNVLALYTLYSLIFLLTVEVQSALASYASTTYVGTNLSGLVFLY